MLEVPVDMQEFYPSSHGNIGAPFPSNVVSSAHFHPRCYNHQTDEARTLHQHYINRAKKVAPNILFTGRHGSFKYWGMPEVVHNANTLVKENFK